jgi:hypothetical protein
MVAARAVLVRRCGFPSSSRVTALSGTATVTGVALQDFKHGRAASRRTASSCIRCSGSRGCVAVLAAVLLRLRRLLRRRRAVGRARRRTWTHASRRRPLGCSDIPYLNFRVLWNVPDPDPHHFDGNHNGIGFET